ncbi:MAG: hypothetical protein AB7I42_23075 [Bradyrhizobium sp.]|uniref:hypothetical protein n=1 Tax=Bradyrhizobium sp. TaxID=376 RepID=UPI003D137E00
MSSPTRTGGGVVSLYSGTLTTAGTVTGGTVSGVGGALLAAVQAKFTYGSGGTNAKAYLQTSLDSGTSWVDVACFAFTTSSATRIFRVGMGPGTGTALLTPTDGTLTDDTQVNGVFGDQFRVKLISTGTYAGNTTLAVTASIKST